MLVDKPRGDNHEDLEVVAESLNISQLAWLSSAGAQHSGDPWAKLEDVGLPIGPSSCILVNHL